MPRPIPPARTPLALLAAAVAASALAACGAIRSKEEGSDIVSKRAVGMRAGDFFDTFGPARAKVESPDGTAVYRWESTVGAMPPGVQSLDERVCKLVVTVDKGGRVTAAEVARDTQGRVSPSRCGEIFRAP